MEAELATDCPYCRMLNTGFRLRATFDIRRNSNPGKHWLTWWICNRCSNGITVKLDYKGNSHDPVKVQGDIKQQFYVESIDPRLSVSRAPDHVPQEISSNYSEAIAAIHHRLYTPAGMTLRKALERATLALAPQQPVSNSFRNKTLLARIESLRSQRVITEGLCELAQQIRAIGNSAAHDDDDLDKEGAEQLREFTELFLIYTFTLPARVKSAANENAPEEQGVNIS